MKKLLLLCLFCSGCASDFQKHIAGLEHELQLKELPYFPKCTVREVAPMVVARHGTHHSIRIYDPMIHVPLDECRAWESEIIESVASDDGG